MLIILYFYNRAYAESILIYMGQEPEIAKMAQTFITVYTPNVFLVFTVIAVRKFLQGLGTYYIFYLLSINKNTKINVI